MEDADVRSLRSRPPGPLAPTKQDHPRRSTFPPPRLNSQPPFRYHREGHMAQPTDNSVSGTARSSVSCPQCGAQVTAEPAHAGDKGVLFQCPNCGKMFGIVPGIPEAQQQPSGPSPGPDELPPDGLRAPDSDQETSEPI
ncbi:MAG: zinc-ribbon domain [Actinomycetota bacterium]|nr:zinc-ribbon domain [Actinomycetota bacterium]